MASKPTHPQTTKDIQDILSAYKRSGLTRRQFCAEAGIPLTTLDYYQRRHAKLRQQSGLVPVTILPTAAPNSPGFTLVLHNGRKIESRWDFPESALLRLVKTLEQC